MKTRTLLIVSLIATAALAGCNGKGPGALRPSIHSIHAENSQNYTLVLAFENVGDSRLRYVDGHLGAYAMPDWSGQHDRMDAYTEYFGSNVYAREHGEPPRKLFNDTDLIGPLETALATAIVRFDKPLPATAHLSLSVYMTYDPEDGSRWGWTYHLPCLNTRGEPILNPDGRNCELLLYDHIQKPPGTYPWGSP